MVSVLFLSGLHLFKTQLPSSYSLSLLLLFLQYHLLDFCVCQGETVSSCLVFLFYLPLFIFIFPRRTHLANPSLFLPLLLFHRTRKKEARNALFTCRSLPCPLLPVRLTFFTRIRVWYAYLAALPCPLCPSIPFICLLLPVTTLSWPVTAQHCSS